MDCISLFQVDERSVGHTQSPRTSEPEARQKLLCQQMKSKNSLSIETHDHLFQFFLAKYSVLCYLDKAFERAFVTLWSSRSGTSYFPMSIFRPLVVLLNYTYM